MNISLTEEGKKMSFKAFVKMFGKHFETDQEAAKKFTELTGKKVGSTRGNDSKNKSV
jgi:hypothetical protein